MRADSVGVAERIGGAVGQGVVTGVTDPQRRQRRLHRVRVFAARLILVVVLIAAWQYFGPKIGQQIASSPVAVYHSLVAWWSSGNLIVDLGATIEEFCIGYVAGAIAGVSLGVLIGNSLFFSELLDPFILALFGIPVIALAPLVIAWFGIFVLPKIVLAGILVLFFCFYSTYQGIRGIDKHIVQAVQLMGANKWQLSRRVIIPGARPGIVLGLKLGVPQALVGAIIGEFITASKGVGYFIEFASARLDTASVFAGLLVLAAIAVVLNAIVKAVSRLGPDEA